MIPDSDGLGHCALINPNLGNGLGLRISFSVESLPFLSEWKMMGEGDYVVGLEPVNVRIENRAILRKEGLLPFLKPGESRTMRVEIGILDGIKEIEAFPSKAQT
jgi:hypothetical protein